MNKYEVVQTLGRGSYGRVDLVRLKSSGEQFAMKKVKLSSVSDGDKMKALDEVKVLSKLKHPNIVTFIESFQENNSLFIVMEYMDVGDLAKKIEQRGSSYLSENEIMFNFVQILLALSYLHDHKILHRDIKPANLLLSANGILKICDLGLCRILPEKLAGIGGAKTADETHAWTLQVGTSFYRAPELLLGDRGYGEAIDIWAVGCVFAELLTGKPLFPGQGDIEQLGFITNLLGSPDETRWPGFAQLADFGQIVFKEREPADIRERFPSWSNEAVDLFKRFIVYEPGKRISAREAMQHEWFFCEPAPMIAPFDGSGFDILNGTYI